MQRQIEQSTSLFLDGSKRDQNPKSHSISDSINDSSCEFGGISRCSLILTVILIPTRNEKMLLMDTLTSIFEQKNALYKIIVIDCGSTDGTLDYIASFENERVRCYSYANCLRFDGINKVLPQLEIRHGYREYIQVVFPGCQYLWPDALSRACLELDQSEFPDLFFSSAWTFQTAVAGPHKDWHEKPLHLLRPYSIKVLQQGYAPSELECIWIKKTLFDEMGLFSPQLEGEGGLDFVMRIYQKNTAKTASTSHVYVIRERGDLAPLKVRIKEKFRIIRNCYGVVVALRWLFSGNRVARILRYWKREVWSRFKRRSY